MSAIFGTIIVRTQWQVDFGTGCFEDRGFIQHVYGLGLVSQISGWSTCCYLADGLGDDPIGFKSELKWWVAFSHAAVKPSAQRQGQRDD